MPITPLDNFTLTARSQQGTHRIGSCNLQVTPTPPQVFTQLQNQPTMAEHPSLPVILSPSILAADFSNLAAEVKKVEAAGGKWVHVDMFDGTLVPNFTIGPPVVGSLRKNTPLFLDCHLAVKEPEKYIEALAQAGGDSCSFHIEAVPDIDEAAALAQKIRSLGMKANIALSPGTPASAVEPLVERGAVDMVLCMTVTPGFGGQKMLPEALEPVRQLRAKYPDLNIQVDGGINSETVAQAAQAGANVMVAGSAVFGVKQGVEQAVKDLTAAIAANLAVPALAAVPA